MNNDVLDRQYEADLERPANEPDVDIDEAVSDIVDSPVVITFDYYDRNGNLHTIELEADELSGAIQQAIVNDKELRSQIEAQIDSDIENDYLK